MRKFLTVLCLVLLPLALVAQQRTGNINGTVVDEEGNPLPGVTMTLTGGTIAPITSVSSAEGKFRFLSLFPASDYVVKAELQGFKTKTETGIIVNVARTADILVTMEVGTLAEQITVVAVTPIVDTKKTQVTHTVSYDMLQSLPSARDPWVILQMTPSIQLDRENIGGVESGQQSSYMARGSTTQEWTVDGMQTTDRNSISSPGYYDFDSFEEMNVSVGSLDVEHRDPGIVVNIVTRRGGNRLSLGGRFYYTDEKFQAEVPQSTLTEYGVAGYNRAIDIKDFGFNAGGPLVKDKAWWWVSYGVQQVQTINVLNVRDDTYLNNYNAKLNFQLLPQNRMEFLYMLGDKKKYGRSSSNSFPPGWNQGSKFHFGNPTWKLQDEHMFGDNLFLSLRIGKSNPGFGMSPANDMDLSKVSYYDVEKSLYYNSQTYFYSDRPHPYGVIQAQYFNDNIMGTAHEIKVGFEVNNNSRANVGGYPGNVFVLHNYNYDIVDWDGDGTIDTPRDDFGIDLNRITVYRDNTLQDGNDRIAAYFSDLISVGRLNFNLGVRMDRGKPFREATTSRSLFKEGQELADEMQENYADIALQLFTPDAVNKISTLLPDRQMGRIEAQKLFTFFSPRLGVTYDVAGDGKTVLKGAFSLYPGGYLGTGYWTPRGLGGWMRFYWDDADGNNLASLNELYWASYGSSARPTYRVFDDAGNFQGNTSREYGLMYSGFTWGSEELTRPSSYIDLDDWKTSQTHEVSLSVERELFQDFGVSLGYVWKRMGRYSTSYPYYPEEFFPGLNNHVRSKDDYEIGGYVPDTLTGSGGQTFDPKDAAGRPWYVLKAIPQTGTTPYSLTKMMDPDRHNIYWGLDFVFTKRLANKWMLNGSATYQMQRSYYGDYGYTDPTNMWAYEGDVYGVSMGGTSGKINQTYFTRWMVKLSGLYQLPWNINVSATLSAHEGVFNSTTFGVQNRTLPNPRSYSNTLETTTYGGRERLPHVYNISAKLEKMFQLGDASRMYFSVDIFNVMNSNVLLRKYAVSHGTFRFTGVPGSESPYAYYVPGANSGKNNELMNPLCFRLGMRFQL